MAERERRDTEEEHVYIAERRKGYQTQIIHELTPLHISRGGSARTLKTTSRQKPRKKKGASRAESSATEAQSSYVTASDITFEARYCCGDEA